MSFIHKTPVRKSDEKKNCFSVLPKHMTPPSSLTKFIARNPFEADLTSKLHISVISPTVFSKVVTPKCKNSPGFTWSVEELALLHPAEIDESPIQHMHCSDPEIEKNAQEAISRFFSENQIIPSPLETTKKAQFLGGLRESPLAVEHDANLTETKDCWTQTALSLPPQLPSHVEEVLKPYLNFDQEAAGSTCSDIGDKESVSSNNSSLRRKLFSNNDDSDESDDDLNSSVPLSLVNPNISVIQNLSPPQSGMFFHGTPLRVNMNSTSIPKDCSLMMQRTYGSPLGFKGDSPCDVSPIGNSIVNMSCQSIKSGINRSVIKLDFTKDMSIETSIVEEPKDEYQQVDMYKTLFSKNMSESNFGKNQNSDITPKFDRFKSEKIKKLEFGQSNFSESYALQQSNMLSSGSNFTQDTGYHTFSSNGNITTNMDSCSTSVRKIHLPDTPAPIEEEVHSSEWKKICQTL